MDYSKIISNLPYSEPFLFVDEIQAIDSEGVKGSYTFKANEYFYQGHFKNHPITPGVILIEVMAQIGLVCLGLFLKDESDTQGNMQLAFTESKVDFYLPVLPGEKVTVVSKKEYYRFNKLKSKVELFNEQGALVCKGVLAGMMTNSNKMSR